MGSSFELPRIGMGQLNLFSHRSSNSKFVNTLSSERDTTHITMLQTEYKTNTLSKKKIRQIMLNHIKLSGLST